MHPLHLFDSHYYSIIVYLLFKKKERERCEIITDGPLQSSAVLQRAFEFELLFRL